MKINKILRKNFFLIIIILLGTVIGSFLMFSSFSVVDGYLQVSTKAWSDFASHIPLIRSFSLGVNFPVEYPLFPGEPIKYHFLFYFFIGFLEKIGLPIDIALNIPSVIGFVILTTMIFLFARKIFKSEVVGLLSVIFFLFNSSLSFIYFFNKYPFSNQTIGQIINNTNFLSFAPYGDGIVSAFWNLNIYTNQRHLAFAFGMSLIMIYLVLKPVLENKNANLKHFIIIGILLGLSFYFHLAILLMTSVVMLALAISFKKIRFQVLLLLIVATLISIPQYLYLSSSEGFSPIINFGYLVVNNFTINKFIEFWIYNIGISLILIPLGFLLSNKNQRKIFISFFLIFLIGNSIQFSIEIAANHKFFNYFMLIGNMFSAYAIYIVWKKKNYLKPISLLFIFLMIFGGIIDFFPLYNDTKISIPDFKKNPTSTWIQKNTPNNSLFLNTTFLYNPASLAGRKIYFGWPYFAWSQGYNTHKRNDTFKSILESSDKNLACKLLMKNNIDFIELKIQTPPDPDIPMISKIYTDKFINSFEDTSTNTKIINVKNNCL